MIIDKKKIERAPIIWEDEEENQEDDTSKYSYDEVISSYLFDE